MVFRWFARYLILISLMFFCIPLSATAETDGFLRIIATNNPPLKDFLAAKPYYLPITTYSKYYERFGDTYGDISCALSAWEYEDSNKECPRDHRLSPPFKNSFRLPPLMPSKGFQSGKRITTTPFQLFSDYEGDFAKFTFAFGNSQSKNVDEQCSFNSLGEVRLFFGDDIPEGWLPADGRTLQIRDYNPLFNKIGTTYGGRGRTTFKLPLLSGALIYMDGSMKTATPVVRVSMDAPMLEYYLGEIILSLHRGIGFLWSCEGIEIASIEGRYPRTTPVSNENMALYSILGHHFGNDHMTLTYPRVFRKSDAEGDAIEFYMVTEGLYPASH